MIHIVKQAVMKVLESSPYGYAIGATIAANTDIILPHEADYHGFALLRDAYPGDIIDLGANMGHSSRGIRKVVGAGRPIFAVEANPLHEPRLARLKRRMEDFDYTIAAAHSRSGETLTLYTPVLGSIVCHSAAGTNLDEVKTELAAIWPAYADRFAFRETTTRTLALDDLGLSPGMVKLDIQGNEMDALAGFAATIARTRPAMLCEMTAHIDELKAFFDRLGYAPYTFDAAGRSFSPLGSTQTSRNVFFLPRGGYLPPS